MASRSHDVTPPEMEVATVGDSTVMAPKESLTYKNCEGLEAALRDNVDQKRIKIILDCKAIPFLDSEALELLVRMHEDLEKRGGALKMVGMNDVCRDILLATRLIGVFSVYRDVLEATRSGT